MRPLAWGLLIFIASGLVWVISSFGAFAESLRGHVGATMAIMYISGAIFFFSIPVAIVAEIIRWWKSRHS